MQIRSWLVGGSIVITGFSAACSSGGSDPGNTNDDGGGSSSSGGASAGPCEAAGKRICEKASACAAAPPKCKTGYRNQFGTFATFTWSDQADCEGEYAVNRCKNGGKPGVDYTACGNDVEATACEGDVFVVPGSCEPPRDAG